MPEFRTLLTGLSILMPFGLVAMILCGCHTMTAAGRPRSLATRWAAGIISGLFLTFGIVAVAVVLVLLGWAGFHSWKGDLMPGTN